MIKDGKTPVTLLHEFLMKGGEIPDYKLVDNGVGTHDPLFQYEVSAKGKSSLGKGKSKKEAKHDAARLLLIELQEGVQLEEEVQVISPYASALKENAVGALIDFCIQHNATCPRYDLIRDEGLAHAKVFGVRCYVSSFSTEAEARTKKQAKQLASQLMLSKLQNCLNDDENFSIASSEKLEEVEKADNACARAEEAFDKILQERLNGKDKMSYCKLGTSINNFGFQFLDTIKPLSETLRALSTFEDSYIYNHKNPEELIKSIMTELDYNYSFGSLDSKDKNIVIRYLQINEINYAVFIACGSNAKQSKNDAIVQALTFFKLMTKD